jgi:hypothetical protein
MVEHFDGRMELLDFRDIPNETQTPELHESPLLAAS